MGEWVSAVARTVIAAETAGYSGSSFNAAEDAFLKEAKNFPINNVTIKSGEIRGTAATTTTTHTCTVRWRDM